MKIPKLLTVLLIFMTNSAFAQTADAGKIIGSYLTEGNKGKVVIIKKSNKYYGTLVWANIPNALDKNNVDEKERKNLIAGKIILKDFVYSSNNTWENGTIYDPESGKTYNGKITLDNNGNLKIRGFVGVSLFGRTTTWIRTN